MTNNFAHDLIKLEQEVMALKTSQQLSPRLRCYTYRFTIGSTNYPNGHGRVTYEDGDNAIVTTIYSDLSVWTEQPNSNKQDFYIRAYTASQLLNAPVYVMSTRPIVGVTMLD